ncbi:short-chain dehydrogenase [Knoellia sinensis KCTC 19936]|uniref:Short-chain dehydrogenase n=1 Tax=Knoellia sinensis KCTC 19936 TaxID=1385520 RepID=A0A0A0J082_9MICO|nr:SDR family oxidoreductase [Knoellia sinensis]KGN30139.1 short-chain dehydrogenase [Knoellia sinensis KCTC 19936]
MSSRGAAVVTGAGRGLGKEIARLLVQRGYAVLVTDVDAATAQASADEIGAAGWRVVDVRVEAQVREARDAALVGSGQIDVWVNNAGVLFTGPAWEQTEEQRRLMLEVNALGAINGTLAAIDSMRGVGGGTGHIINIVSLAGLTAVPGEAVYAASKHAAIGFSLSTLADLRLAGVEGIDISCVCPDGIWTPMLHDKLDDPEAALSFSGKLLQPEEVVTAVGRVLDRPRPVTALPGWRGLQVRFGDVFPRVQLLLTPMLVQQGRRAQRKFLAKGVRSRTNADAARQNVGSSRS